MDALDNTRRGKVMDELSCFRPVFSSENQLTFARLVNLHFGSTVEIAICMAGQGDGFRPGFDIGLNAFDQDRSTEHGTVHDGADGSVRALPHFFQLIFLHALQVWRDGGAFDGNTVFVGGISGVYRNLIIGEVTVADA